MPDGLDLIVIPDTPWDRIVWTNRQHIMVRLPRLNPHVRVLYVAPPRFLGRRLQVPRGAEHPSLWTTRVAERVWVVQPLLPAPRRLLSRIAPGLGDRLMIAVARRASARLGFASPCVWSYSPVYAPHIGAFAEEFLVYDVVDDYAAMPYYRSTLGTRARDLDGEMTRSADLVFVVNDFLLKQRRAWNARCRFVDNAGDVRSFAAARSPIHVPADIASIDGPRIGFHGTLTSDKIDVPLLAEIAWRRRDWSFVLIGPEKDGVVRQVLGSLPNVHFLGSREANRLPAYLGGFDALLIPYRRTGFTGRPLKVYEGLAAGVPVVATGLPELDGEPGVTVSTSDPISLDGAIASVLDAAAAPVPLESLERYSWESKARRQLDLVLAERRS
jgi:glycosyltransferase involved in cell wall biosynthesis